MCIFYHCVLCAYVLQWFRRLLYPYTIHPSNLAYHLWTNDFFKPSGKTSNLHSIREDLLQIFFNKAAKSFKSDSKTCLQNFHQGCQSRHNFASTNGTNDITTKIKTEGDFKLANQRARKYHNIGHQPISFGTSHQPISFGTIFGTYIWSDQSECATKKEWKNEQVSPLWYYRDY